MPDESLRTPDGRYIVVRGRLWRASNPHLPAAERERLVKALMNARRAVGQHQRAKHEAGVRRARRVVPLEGVNSYRLLSMSMDDDGFIWVGSIHRVIHRYDPRIEIPFLSSASRPWRLGAVAFQCEVRGSA